jgi:hypothetical protein
MDTSRFPFATIVAIVGHNSQASCASSQSYFPTIYRVITSCIQYRSRDLLPAPNYIGSDPIPVPYPDLLPLPKFIGSGPIPEPFP